MPYSYPHGHASSKTIEKRASTLPGLHRFCYPVIRAKRRLCANDRLNQHSCRCRLPAEQPQHVLRGRPQKPQGTILRNCPLFESEKIAWGSFQRGVFECEMVYKHLCWHLHEAASIPLLCACQEKIAAARHYRSLPTESVAACLNGHIAYDFIDNPSSVTDLSPLNEAAK